MLHVNEVVYIHGCFMLSFAIIVIRLMQGLS